MSDWKLIFLLFPIYAKYSNEPLQRFQKSENANEFVSPYETPQTTANPQPLPFRSSFLNIFFPPVIVFLRGW